MSGRLFVIANAGRSGSTFLWHALMHRFQEAHVAHEDIPVQVTKPRYYNRAYDSERRQDILSDSKLRGYLERWRDILHERDVIETGWTCYHLLPVLKDYFGDQLNTLVLVRHPFEVACSRATMGNFHPRTFYDDAHEVSAFDPHTIAPEWRSYWSNLNHFEKCLYWWYVIYREIFEFHKRNNIPLNIFYFENLINDLWAYRSLLEALGHTAPKSIDEIHVANKNPQSRFMSETFPLRDEWQAYAQHPTIIQFAEKLGYEFDHEKFLQKAQKYQLSGLMPKFRHAIGYWRIKRRGGEFWRKIAAMG